MNIYDRQKLFAAADMVRQGFNNEDLKKSFAVDFELASWPDGVYFYLMMDGEQHRFPKKLKT